MSLYLRRWARERGTYTVFTVVFLLHILFLFGVATLIHPYGSSLAQLVTGQDAAEFLSLGKSLYETGNFYLHNVPVPETFRTIGYPAIIAGIYFLTGGSSYVPGKVMPEFGDGFYGVLGFLALLGALTSALIYRIGVMIGLRNRFAIAAGILFGVSPAVIFLPVTGMGSDMVFVFLLTICLYLLLTLEQSSTKWLTAILIGGILGYATLTRPVGQYLSLMLIAAIPFFAQARYLPRVRQGIVLIGIALLTFVLVLSPWLIRNYQLSGEIQVSSISSYSFGYYNIPAFLAFYKKTSEADERNRIVESIGNPPDKTLRSLFYTREWAEIDKAFLKTYALPYLGFHIIKTIPFFLGSGVDVSYAVISIETKNQLNIPFLPHVDANLSHLVYAGDYIGVMKNLITYWPATLERLIWATLFVLVLISPFVATEHRTRKFFILGILFIGATAFLASPVVQPRYRIPTEPFIWISALYAGMIVLDKTAAWRKQVRARILT